MTKGRGLERDRALSVFSKFSRGARGDGGGVMNLGKLEKIGCVDGGESEQSLKDEPAPNGEGVVATKVASFVQAVDRFEPPGRFGKQIPNSGKVVGSHRADRAGQKQGERNGVESRGAKKDEKNSPSNDLVGDREGKEAGEFCFAVGGGVDPVADA